MLLSLFALLFVLVRQGQTQAWDEAIMRWLYARSTPMLQDIFQIITDTGGVGRNVPLTIALIWFWTNGYRRETWTLAGAAGGAQLLTWTVKFLIHRTRPTVFETLRHPPDTSFPSGHALGSLVVYGWLAIWLWRRGFRVSGMLVGVWAWLIGFTRVYLGVHYPTDVLASWTLGLAWLLLVMDFYDQKKVQSR